MARVHPACHTSIAQVTSIFRVSLRAPPSAGLTEEALASVQKQLYYLAPHLSSTKELSCVYVRTPMSNLGRTGEVPVQFFTHMALCWSLAAFIQ